ncbi:MAG: hypothetical protein Kow0059_22350 [Candidatus Sumerlaeia bacterium]
MTPISLYRDVASGVFQVALAGLLAGATLAWIHHWRRARVFAGQARPLFALLWICLIASGGGAVWATLEGEEATFFFVNTAVQVVLSMALLPVGLMLLRRSGFADMPHLRRYALRRRFGPGGAPRRTGGRNVPAPAGGSRLWAGIIGWTLVSVVGSLVYWIALERWVGPELSPQMAALLQDQSSNPLLVMSLLLTSAVGEEVQFRMLGLGLAAWLLRRQTGRPRPALAVVLVAVVWALGHAEFLVQPFWKELHMLGLGLIFGMMIRRYGATTSLLPHMILNVFAAFDVF